MEVFGCKSERLTFRSFQLLNLTEKSLIQGLQKDGVVDSLDQASQDPEMDLVLFVSFELIEILVKPLLQLFGSYFGYYCFKNR